MDFSKETKKIINQVFLGEYSKEEDRTLVGTALEIAVGFTPIGIIQDVRDLTYYLQIGNGHGNM